MSKNSGKSKRLLPIPEEEKRPSVFERLGVRRDNSSTNYQAAVDPRWPDTMQGSSARDSSRQRGGQPLFTDKRQPNYSPPVGSGGKSHGKEVKLLTTPKKSKGKDHHSKKAPRSEEKRGNKKRAIVKNKVVDKKKKKARASSASSGETSDDSSSSHSSSSSSSSSSNNSSSSDSSVPSVQLNSEKSKSKKIIKSKVDKKLAPTPYRSSRSSSSGVDSIPQNKRGPIPIDLREKLNARSPSGINKDPNLKKIGDKRPKPYVRGSSPLLEDRNKKRGPPDSFPQHDDMKRRKMLSPSPVDKYRIGVPSDEPPHHRRAPPQMQDLPKRGRSPQNFHRNLPHQQQQQPPHQQQRSNYPSDRRPDMPPRRPDRPDFRNNDRDRRNSPFPPKGDYDKRRDQPPPEYPGRDNRPRERVAPTRPPVDMRQERDRMDRPNNDYQRRPQQQQLRSPYMHQGDQQNQGRNNFNNNYNKSSQNPYDKDRQRFPNNPRPEEKRQPLLPKSKEALAERYEQMRKSGYVDKWVDETVKVQRGGDVSSPLLPTPSPSSKIVLSPERLKQDNFVQESLLPAVEDLSDFSDDADELLNTNPESPVVVDKEIADTPKSPKSSVPSVSPIKTKERLSTEVPIIPLSIQQRSTSVETAPSILSQERGGSLSKAILRTSLTSQSQTDDLLDRMDFEEISDEELGEVVNKVHIVDALGVDWASLVCQEKKGEDAAPESLSKSTSARKRWRPINILSGRISKELAGESLYNRVTALKQAEDANDVEQSESGESNEVEQKTTRPRDFGVLEKIGLGPNSRALSARRDMAVRRYLLDLPPKKLTSLDVFHNNTTTSTPEMDSIGELYKMSIALFKANRPSNVVALR